MYGAFKKLRFLDIVKSILIISSFIGFVLLVNKSVIDFSMMYPEQPIMYLANQKINTIWDLINVYLHPRVMHFSIPFFRPSGHFLMYQLVTPFLGWHNFKAFIIVNLVFLALTGFVLVRIYTLLFPGFRMGGYIAFAILLMHPALTLSRFISLHFEFAYIFFLVTALYCFVLFCEKNKLLDSENVICIRNLRLAAMGWFLGAMMLYFVAITFKEPSLMLGPVLALFLLIMLYDHAGILLFFRNIIKHKQLRTVFLLLGMVTLTFAVYLTLPWPTFSNPFRKPFSMTGMLSSLNYFLDAVFNVGLIFSLKDELNLLDINVWRNVPSTPVSIAIVWFLTVLSMAVGIILFYDKTQIAKQYRKSLLFCLLASLIFLVLPIGWGMGYPWHFSLTILMMGIIAGFSFDYSLSKMIRRQKLVSCLSFFAAILIGLQAISVNRMSVEKYNLSNQGGLVFGLLQNAVLHPPDIKKKLNETSLVLIEDALLGSWYITGGGGMYPFLVTRFIYSYDWLYAKMGNSILPINSNYNGTIFRWSYLMPNLKETPYPFKVEQMYKVDNMMIYQWLLHYNDIFCLGYDKNGQWHDKTGEFKKNLLHEKLERKLIVGQYTEMPFAILSGAVLVKEKLPYPDEQVCKYQCDQDINCRGFSYMDLKVGEVSSAKCYFYKVIEGGSKPCPVCTSYVKT